MTDRGDWMQTYTGAKFYPMSPSAEDVDPVDIAHSLSLLCRYNGHLDRFYSVGEHCVLMSQAVEPENALWALLHDATEAYVGDMVRPLKLQQPAFVQAEDRVMAAICERFGLDLAMPAEVKAADSRIILTERAALISNGRHAWSVDGLDPLPVVVRGWGPDEAERAYLARLRQLGVT
jgi:hypothetical protein